MAIGIDRATHKKLIEGLMQLSNGRDTSQWKAVLDDLKNAYEETMQTFRMAELSALAYNEMQASIRTQVAIELRNRKRIDRLSNKEL